MDWNYILGDAEFYGIEVAELLAYVLLVAGVAIAVETVIDRIRGRKAPASPTAQGRGAERPLPGR
jgi:hypothetical protein